jgi:hypothetical protein
MIYRNKTGLTVEVPGYEEMYGAVNAIAWSAAAFGDVVTFGTESSWIFVLSNAAKPEVRGFARLRLERSSHSDTAGVHRAV